MFVFGQRKKITEKLYEQNLELAVKNKTLSLLESLYQTSVLTLTPEEMAQAITDIIRKDLNLECASVFIFQKESDLLTPLAFSKSERLVGTLQELGLTLKGIKIANVSKRTFFQQAVYEQKYNITNDIQEVWEGCIPKEHLEKIKEKSHIKTALLAPLIKGEEVLGVLLLMLNRDYQTLSTFEKASIKIFINVIALLLDKAYLYKYLQESYELEKKAKEDINRAYGLEKKAKEELEKLDKFKDDLLKMAQHDLRKPLAIIMGYSDLILRGIAGKIPKKALEMLGKMQLVTQGKIKDINNFLDAEQFKLGKGVVNLVPGVELLPILDQIIDELSFTAKTKGIYLKFKKPLAKEIKEKKFIVSADKEKLKSSIFNIVDNAVKYTEKGGVMVKLQITNDKLQITVEDTGIGIPPEKIKGLLDEQFERTEDAKRVASGSGVGLYLATQIIKMHNGKVWVESELGKGSLFYVELPAG